MSDDPAEPPTKAGLTIPRVLREKETFCYEVRVPKKPPEVWLFGGARNVIPGIDDEEDADELPQEMTVELGGGGTVTLKISANLFKLTPADREFVFGLVDALRKYES